MPNGATSEERRGAEGAREFPAVVLTLSEAAWAAGLAREELEAAVRAGRLRVRRVVRGGRVVSVVALDELEALHGEHRARCESREELTHRLETRVARLEGELAASEKVERSLQRYADRLEERSATRIAELESHLSEARRREMTLARVLGQTEARLARYEALGSAPEEPHDAEG